MDGYSGIGIWYIYSRIGIRQQPRRQAGTHVVRERRGRDAEQGKGADAGALLHAAGLEERGVEEPHQVGHRQREGLAGQLLQLLVGSGLVVRWCVLWSGRKGKGG